MSELALPVDQQRADAPGILGASDAPAALGLDPYRPPIAVWRQARGLAAPDERPAFVQEAAEWGQILEPVIRGKYAIASGVAVWVPLRSLFHPTRPWLRATPDGLVCPAVDADAIGTHEVDAPRETMLAGVIGELQVKTCSAFLRHEWEERPPPRYEVQVRTEMAVAELPWCDVVCLVGGQHYAGPFRVWRDAGIEELILGDLDEFHDRIVRDIEPELDGSKAWREHVSEKLLRAAGTIEAPTAELLREMNEWREARRAATAAIRAEDEAKNRILLRMSAAGATRIKVPEGGAATAYPTPMKPRWKDYALALGGNEATAKERYRDPSKSFTLRAPSGWGDDE